MTPDSLPAEWRQRAQDLRRYGAEPQAATLEAAAGELEVALEEAAAEELALAQASAESGYSERRLRELIASGEIPQAGRRGRPRIRRRDLPRKPSKSSATSGYDPAADARELLGKMSA